MARFTPLEGIIAYSLTPFSRDGCVDFGIYRQLVERLVAAGVHAIAPLGSTGVLPYLADREREAVVDVTVECVAGRLPILVGVSSLTTERTLHHARYAESRGAAAIMVIPLSYWKLSEAEIFRHFQTVSDAISLPIMVYNNPQTGGLDMTPRFLARLLEIPNVTMIKESTGDVSRFHQLKQFAGPDLAFYNGHNPLALEAFQAGAKGWCTAAANLIPQLNLDLYAATRKGNWGEASRLFKMQLPLLEQLVQGGLPRTVLAGLRTLGIDAGMLRPPLLELAEADSARLSATLLSVLGEG